MNTIHAYSVASSNNVLRIVLLSEWLLLVNFFVTINMFISVSAYNFSVYKQNLQVVLPDSYEAQT